jgi:glycosyltransferase involved in cell wall biosynthesis
MKKKLFIVSTISKTLNFFNGQVRFLNKEFDIELVASPDYILDFVRDREGVKVHPIKMVREISIFKDLKSLFNLVSLFNREKPDAVHGNTPKGGLLSMTAAWFTRVPYRIYYVHGLRYEGDTGLKRNILMTLERVSCYFATHIIAVSFGIKENLLLNGITKKIPIIIGNGSANGIDPINFSKEGIENKGLRKKHGILESDLLFGYLGRLVGDKGINELISVFVQLNKKHKNIKLLLVGWYEDELDPLKEAVKNEIESNKNIIAVGAQVDVRPFLSIMDIFVFPSYREGFGVSIMEAATMGVPVICSNISGCNEIIKDGYNGKLITPKATSELYNAMDLFITNPDVLHQMKAVTRDYILEKYSQKFVWQEALKTYSEIIIHDI